MLFTVDSAPLFSWLAERIAVASHVPYTANFEIGGLCEKNRFFSFASSFGAATLVDTQNGLQPVQSALGAVCWHPEALRGNYGVRCSPNQWGISIEVSSV